jgi:hypothetical protein
MKEELLELTKSLTGHFAGCFFRLDSMCHTFGLDVATELQELELSKRVSWFVDADGKRVAILDPLKAAFWLSMQRDVEPKLSDDIGMALARFQVAMTGALSDIIVADKDCDLPLTRKFGNLVGRETLDRIQDV